MDRTIHKRIGQALFEQDVPDFTKFDYFVALDIGGGNSSAAVANLQPYHDSTPRMLRLTARDETSLWSNIGYDARPGEQGKMTIGKQAQAMKYQFSNYKVVPTDENLELVVAPDNYVSTGDFLVDASVKRTNRELTRDYIRELFHSICNHPKNMVLRKTPLHRILIIVGHPSSDDWKNKQAHNNLVKIIREATGVSSVLTTSESNAAILYALNNRSQIGEADKILIVDLGAYSADITWIDRRNLKRRYSSIALGGKSVDGNIARIILENSGRDHSELDQDYNLIYEARNLKEQFWPRGEKDQKTYARFSGKDFQIIVTNKQFDKAVQEMPFPVQDPSTGQDVSRSYTDHLSAFLEEAKTKLKIMQVDWVLITGGAARMKPAMEVIRSKSRALWGVQEEKIWPSNISDSLIDESVPYGSLQFCIKSRDVLDGIPSVYDELKSEAEKMVSPMAEKISKEIMDYLMPKAIEPVLTRFRDTDEISTIEKLETTLDAELKKYAHKEKIRSIAQTQAKEVANNSKLGFQRVIARFLNNLYGRSAGTASWKWSTNIDPEIDYFDGRITKAIQEAVSNSIGEAIVIILGAIILMLSPLLLAAIVAIIVGCEAVAENWREKHYTPEERKKREREQEAKREQKKLEERQKNRSKGARKKIYNKLMSEESKEELRGEVEKKIQNQLERRCSVDGFGVPKAYLDQLTNDICNAVYTGL